MAGTVTVAFYPLGNDDEKIVFSFTADASDGSIPSTGTGKKITGYVSRAVVNPGTPAPTDGFDVTITDSGGVDIFETDLNDQSASSTLQSYPKVGGTSGPCYVDSVLTLNISNNSVNSAVGTVTLYVDK